MDILAYIMQMSGINLVMQMNVCVTSPSANLVPTLIELYMNVSLQHCYA